MALSQSADVLQDSLLILASKEIKLSSSRAHTSEDMEDEQESAISAAKGKLLSKIVKKNILENIVPILIELKHLLEKHRSPLLKYLMMYLKELLKDFKSELQDIVVGDKQLAKELEYDLRMWEKKAAAGTPTSMRSPSQTMFSPKARNTPRPDLAKFSVPKLKPTPSASKTPRSASSASSSSSSSYISSSSISKTPIKRHSPAIADSPYKTPRKSIDPSAKHIVFTPDPSRQRRWSIELVADENDQNAQNTKKEKQVKGSKKEKDTKNTRVTKKRAAKKSVKLSHGDDDDDDREESGEEVHVPAFQYGPSLTLPSPASQKRRSRT